MVFAETSGWTVVRVSGHAWGYAGVPHFAKGTTIRSDIWMRCSKPVATMTRLVIEPFGMIGLDLTRNASSAEDALRSAFRNVQAAIPGATLAQAGPDLVGLTEIAAIFGFSRQNMRKYATGGSSAHNAFPSRTIIGEPSLWHLAEIVCLDAIEHRGRTPA